MWDTTGMLMYACAKLKRDFSDKKLNGINESMWSFKNAKERLDPFTVNACIIQYAECVFLCFNKKIGVEESCCDQWSIL